MGKRDDRYTFMGVEIDEGFFPTEVTEDKEDEKPKRGTGSQSKTKVLVMAESENVENPRNPDKPKKVGRIKMAVIGDLRDQKQSHPLPGKA